MDSELLVLLVRGGILVGLLMAGTIFHEISHLICLAKMGGLSNINGSAGRVSVSVGVGKKERVLFSRGSGESKHESFPLFGAALTFLAGPASHILYSWIIFYLVPDFWIFSALWLVVGVLNVFAPFSLAAVRGDATRDGAQFVVALFLSGSSIRSDDLREEAWPENWLNLKKYGQPMDGRQTKLAIAAYYVTLILLVGSLMSLAGMHFIRF